jgi:MFS family permease
MRSLFPPLGWRAWRLLLADTFTFSAKGLSTAFLIIYLHDVHGIDLAVAGSILAVSGAAGLLAFPVGSLVDRFGGGRIAVLCLILSAIGTAGFILIQGPLTAFGAAFLVGLGTGGYLNSVSPTFASAVSPEQRGAVFGVSYALRNVGLGLGVLTGGSVLNMHTPQTFAYTFYGSAALFLLVAALFIIFGETRYSLSPTSAAAAKSMVTMPAGNQPVGSRSALRDRLLLAVTILNLLLMIAGISQLSSAFPAWTTGPAHSSIQVVGFGFAANSFTIVSLQLFVLRFLRGRRRTQATAAAALVFAGSWLLMLFAGKTSGGRVTAGMIIAAMIIFGSGETLLSPSLTGLLNDLAPDGLRGRYNAVFNLSLQIGPILAPILSGSALAYGLGGALLVALAAICTSAAVFAIWLERFVSAEINRGYTTPHPNPIVENGKG